MKLLQSLVSVLCIDWNECVMNTLLPIIYSFFYFLSKLVGLIKFVCVSALKRVIIVTKIKGVAKIESISVQTQ